MISIVIPVKNDRNIDSCIKRLLSFDSRKNPIEIVVVDASNNGVLDDIKRRYKNVTWLYYTNPDKSYTVAEQRNLGISKARGEWIIFLDADCVPQKNWLPNLMKPSLKDGELYITGKVTSNTPTIHDNHWEVLEEKPYRHSSGTCNSLIHRSVFNTIGYFDEDYEAGEDIDFSWRAIDAGFKIRYCPKSVVLIDWGTARQDMKRAIRYGEAKALLYAKHPNRLKQIKVEFTALTYVAYILLLPVAIIFPWYILFIVLPLAKNWKYRPFYTVTYNLLLAWGIIYGTLRLPGYFLKRREKNLPTRNTSNLLIITQQLGANYGGIMQAYALQTVLKNMGFNAVTNNNPNLKTGKNYLLAYLSRFAPWNILKSKKIFVTPKLYRIITKNTLPFIEKNINTIDLFANSKKYQRNIVRSFNYFVVGSDQVWRNRYANIKQNMFDFVDNDSAVRISYAASFGHDNINEYSDSLKKESKLLLDRFNAVSVREKTGVDICEKEWNINAKHVLDPTMLLDKKAYFSNLSGLKNKKNDSIFEYVLDSTDQTTDMIKKIAKIRSLKINKILPDTPKSRRDFIDNPDKYAMAPVENWLNSINNAEFVITDSFHGCVFSIIFNTPFVVLINESRGLARLKSLLETVGLEDRILSNANLEKLEEIADRPINWNDVNKIISKERSRSMKFLEESLGKPAND